MSSTECRASTSNDDARECLKRLEEVKRTAPRFVQRKERAWFNKGKALRKQLSPSP